MLILTKYYFNFNKREEISQGSKRKLRIRSSIDYFLIIYNYLFIGFLTLVRHHRNLAVLVTFTIKRTS
jgi:hypothetical protein